MRTAKIVFMLSVSVFLVAAALFLFQLPTQTTQTALAQTPSGQFVSSELVTGSAAGRAFVAITSDGQVWGYRLDNTSEYPNSWNLEQNVYLGMITGGPVSATEATQGQLRVKFGDQ